MRPTSKEQRLAPRTPGPRIPGILLASLFFAALAGPAPGQLLTPVEGPAAVLSRTSVPAAGRHQAVLTVRRFGRYSVTVESEQGVALQLVDRMAGPGPVHGKPGEENGRLDVFLDYGEYQILTFGHEASEGEAVLAVHSFAEIQPEPVPQLVEFKPIDGTLGDFEQRSYWLQIEEQRWIDLEAAGRTLRDLRLWLDGNWLIDAKPRTEVLTPREGMPLFACRLAIRLDPGLYLVTAYGGREQPWANDTGEVPFHLRLGIPRLGTAGRARFEVSPFGIDRWRVPAQANFYRLELPEARLAVLRVGGYSESAPFAPSGSAARIEKNSRVPAIEITNDVREKGDDIVTVEAEAGQPYVLQHFQRRHHHRFEGAGTYWISTIHSGHPSDSVDATSFLAHWPPHSGVQRRPLREQTIAVGPRQGWAIRSNLLDTLSVFLKIESTGKYVIESEGTAARFLLEPFFVHRPPNYAAPPFRSAGEEWDLEAGYYVLTVEPVRKGILEMAIKPAGGLVDRLLDLIGLGEEVAREPVMASVRFPSVPLIPKHSYEIFLNRQPEVKAGLILRRLPMSLDDPLPLTLRPGDQVTIPFSVSEPSRLEAVAEDGSRLEIRLDQTSWKTTHGVAEGTHTAVVRHDGDQTIVCSVGTVPHRLLSTAPLPPLPEGTLEALPDFPVLEAEHPHFFDLEREQRQVFLVSPGDDALYRLESTGLLDTEGTLRSRVVTALASSGSGGSGRNFFLHQYLNAGDYQLALGTLKHSQGHLGVELTRTDPIDGGELREDLPARIELADGESVVYRFRIAEAGRYRLRSFALGHTPRCRLEDGDRWPIVKPNVPAAFDRHFYPGSYRLLLLPESVAGRRLTLLERVAEPPRFTGHGPHELPLDRTVRHRWFEPAAGEERLSDQWSFELTGPSEVSIRLTGEMHGRVRRGDGREVAYVPPMRGFQGRLEAGSYRFDVECFRRNNRVDYEIAIRPKALLPGLERAVTAPATIPVAVGRGGLVEITSFGSEDVRAWLADDEGRPVARNDDRAGDWNFHLAARLEPGRYTLHLDPVGHRSAATTVRMDAREEVMHEPLSLPAAVTLEPGTAVHTFPLESLQAELLLVSARSSENVGLAVERRLEDSSWETVVLRTDPSARIELALADSPHRLRLWSVDRRENPIELAAAAITPVRLSEKKLARGAALRAVRGFEPAIAVVAVELAAPGTLRLLETRLLGTWPGSAGLEVRWSGVAGAPLEPVTDGFLQAPGRTAWISVGLAGGGAAGTPTAGTPAARLQARRLVLAPGPDAGIQLPLRSGRPAEVDLAAGDGPLLVIVRSMVGQPAVRVRADRMTEHATAGPPDLGPVAIIRNAAAAVALRPIAPTALAWLAEPADEAVDVRLEALSFPPPLAEPAGFGRLSGELDTQTRAFDLPAGGKRFHLVLTPGIVAVFAHGEEVRSVHWNGGRPLAERFTTSSERLLLLHTRSEPDRYTIEILPAADGERSLAAGSPVEILSPTAGTVRIRVDPGGPDDRTVQVYGTARASFLSDRGTVLRGRQIEVGASGGTLLLPHRPGLLLAWIGPPEDAELGLWTGVDVPEPTPVTTPLRLGLSGAVQALAFEVRRPMLLSLSSEGRAVYRLQTSADSTQNGTSRGWIDPGGGVHHAYLPAGRAELAVRAVAGRSLAHDLEVLTIPVTEVGEGLGPEVLLGPGGAHAFHFTVTEPGQVGVGVRADSDTVECELITLEGRLLGRDVVQMHELEAGEYLLLVRLSPAGEAVRARPAVVGIEKPSTGPPADEIRRYLDMEKSGR